jgi:hypothetical protein
MMKKILIALSLLIVETCWAVDIYDPFNNQLKIPSVQVGAKKNQQCRSNCWKSFKY